jgi:hypothetical protein
MQEFVLLVVMVVSRGLGRHGSLANTKKTEDDKEH